MKKKLLFSALCAALIAHIPGQSIAHDHEFKHQFMLDNHKGFVDFGEPEKGTANARIVVDGDTLLMETLTPAYNIHGVEAAPVTRTDEEKTQVAKASRAFLDAPERYFSFMPSHACQMDALAYRREQVEVRQEQAQKHNTNWQYYNVRSEMLFNCPNGTPEQMVVELFSAFPKLQSIHVQLIENGKDLRRIKLTRSAPVLEFSQPAKMMDESAPNKMHDVESLNKKPEPMHEGEAHKKAPNKTVPE